MISYGEVFGFLGGALGVVVALPQALRIRKLGHGQGVSLVMWLITLVVNASWLGYGIILQSPSLVISNIIGFATSSLVVAALLNRGWMTWPAMYLAGGLWLLLELQFSINAITAFLIALTLYRLPQLIKSVKNLRLGLESAVSMKSLFVSLSALTCWMIYSVASGRPQLVLTTSSALVMTLAITTLEIFTARLASKRAALIAVEA